MKKPVQLNANLVDPIKIAPVATVASLDEAIVRELTLPDLWKAGRDIGLYSPNESTQVIRKMRDARY